MSDSFPAMHWYAQKGGLPIGRGCNISSGWPSYTIELGSSWIPLHMVSSRPEHLTIVGLRSPSQDVAITRPDVLHSIDGGDNWMCLNSTGNFATRAGASIFTVTDGGEHGLCIAGGRPVMDIMEGADIITYGPASTEVWCLELPNATTTALPADPWQPSDFAPSAWYQGPSLPTPLVGASHIVIPAPDGRLYGALVGGQKARNHSCVIAHTIPDARTPDEEEARRAQGAPRWLPVRWYQHPLLAAGTEKEFRWQSRIAPLVTWLPHNRLLMVAGGHIDLNGAGGGSSLESSINGSIRGSGLQIDVDIGGYVSDSPQTDMVAVSYSAELTSDEQRGVPSQASWVPLRLPEPRQRGDPGRAYSLAAYLNPQAAQPPQPMAELLFFQSGDQTFVTPVDPFTKLDWLFVSQLRHRTYWGPRLPRSSGRGGYRRRLGNSSSGSSGEGAAQAEEDEEVTSSSSSSRSASPSPFPAFPSTVSELTKLEEYLRNGYTVAAPASKVGMQNWGRPWWPFGHILAAHPTTGQLFKGSMGMCLPPSTVSSCPANHYARCTSSPFDGQCAPCHACRPLLAPEGGQQVVGWDCESVRHPDCRPCQACPLGEVAAAPCGTTVSMDNRTANATHPLCTRADEPPFPLPPTATPIDSPGPEPTQPTVTATASTPLPRPGEGEADAIAAALGALRPEARAQAVVQTLLWLQAAMALVAISIVALSGKVLSTSGTRWGGGSSYFAAIAVVCRLFTSTIATTAIGGLMAMRLPPPVGGWFTPAAAAVLVARPVLLVVTGGLAHWCSGGGGGDGSSRGLHGPLRMLAPLAGHAGGKRSLVGMLQLVFAAALQPMLLLLLRGRPPSIFPGSGSSGASRGSQGKAAVIDGGRGGGVDGSGPVAAATEHGPGLRALRLFVVAGNHLVLSCVLAFVSSAAASSVAQLGADLSRRGLPLPPGYSYAQALSVTVLVLSCLHALDAAACLLRGRCAQPRELGAVSRGLDSQHPTGKAASATIGAVDYVQQPQPLRRSGVGKVSHPRVFATTSAAPAASPPDVPIAAGVERPVNGNNGSGGGGGGGVDNGWIANPVAWYGLQSQSHPNCLPSPQQSQLPVFSAPLVAPPSRPQQHQPTSGASAAAAAPASATWLEAAAASGDASCLLSELHHRAGTPEARRLADMRLYFRHHVELLPEAIAAAQQVPLPPRWQQLLSSLEALIQSGAPMSSIAAVQLGPVPSAGAASAMGHGARAGAAAAASISTGASLVSQRNDGGGSDSDCEVHVQAEVSEPTQCDLNGP